MLWHQVAFILLYTSQFTVLIDYLCILDTTLRVLITRYKLHVMNYISFLGVFGWYKIVELFLICKTMTNLKCIGSFINDVTQM